MIIIILLLLLYYHDYIWRPKPGFYFWRPFPKLAVQPACEMSAADRRVLSYHDSLLKDSDLALLGGSNWLNDKIIGFYFE